MRIIGGAKKGMRLLSPKTDVSRPITDRIKESLFNVLANYGLPAGEVTADLFCGVGSLGLEALSRGAVFVTFVEANGRIIETLKRNVEKAGFAGQWRIVRANAFVTGAPVNEEKGMYGLIFVDPPYVLSKDMEAGSAMGQLLEKLAGQMKEGGFVVVRTEQKTELLERYGQLREVDRRRWGSMQITMFRREAG